MVFTAVAPNDLSHSLVQRFQDFFGCRRSASSGPPFVDPRFDFLDRDVGHGVCPSVFA